MATSKKTKDKKKPEPVDGRVNFSLKPGTRTRITIDVGEVKAGENTSVTIHAERIDEDPAVTAEPSREISQPKRMPVVVSNKLSAGIEALVSRLKAYDLATWLFVGAVVLYLITRLIGLTRYPIYFFTDEAIQTQSIVELIQRGYRDVQDVLFPTYFANGEYHNLSLSVYLQWLPFLLFGKSAVVTRATSVFITLIAAISVGIILRDIFKVKYWWAGTLFLSITPAWFLHSRTAFETAEFTAFYAGTLCAYLLYRYRSPRYLYPTLFLGGLAFYTYSPAQLIVPVTALALLISDWRYHWENRRLVARGLVLVAILALPYIRFRINDPDAPFAQLRVLGSYLTTEMPLSEKVSRYFSEYLTGISPWYWYQFNNRDLERHLMKGYGNIMLATLPFAILGFAYVLRNLRQSSCRAVLIALLVSPVSAALVQTGITRVLMFVIPAAILTAFGLDQVLQWIENPDKRITELSNGSGPTTKRVFASVDIFLAGVVLANFSAQSIDSISILALTALLALESSGVFKSLAQWYKRRNIFVNWNLLPTIIPLAVFLTLSSVNVYMLTDALRNGPLWWRDYGMGGMQYGAFQIFGTIEQYVQEHPDTKVILSPNWANGTDVVVRFFIGNPPSVSLGSIDGYLVRKFPLDDKTLFIMTPDEYSTATSNSKFTDIHVEKIVPYPDGKPGFYFVRLRYADNIDEIFAAEEAVRQILQESIVMVDGQEVKVRFSYLDADQQDESIKLVFDDDPYTLAKTFDNNPFVIEMTFPSPREISGFSIIIGSVNAEITLKGYPAPGAEPIIYIFKGQGSIKQPELSFDLPKPMQVLVLRVEMMDPYSPPPTQVHIWELKLR